MAARRLHRACSTPGAPGCHNESEARTQQQVPHRAFVSFLTIVSNASLGRAMLALFATLPTHAVDHVNIPDGVEELGLALVGDEVDVLG